MKYARNVNNRAVDVRTESPDGCFTSDIVAQFSEVPSAVEDGWILNGETWEVPPAPVIPEPVAPVVIPPKVSPIEFKLLFTAQERVAIKASTDAIVQDFFSIVEDPRLTHVDLALKSTQDALTYLEALDLIAEGRKAEIMTGVPS